MSEANDSAWSLRIGRICKANRAATAKDHHERSE